jgi:hypothetical protein
MEIMKTKLYKDIFASVILFKSTTYRIVEKFCIAFSVLEHEVRKNVLSTVGANSVLIMNSNVNTLRTGDADLRLYITTVQDG